MSRQSYICAWSMHVNWRADGTLSLEDIQKMHNDLRPCFVLRLGWPNYAINTIWGIIMSYFVDPRTVNMDQLPTWMPKSLVNYVEDKSDNIGDQEKEEELGPWVEKLRKLKMNMG